MRILLTGASGLIGSSIAARLLAEGHEVTAVVRRPAAIGMGKAKVVALDIAAATRVEDWLPHLAGVEAIVNCAGVLQEGPRENIRAVHSTGVAALFAACEQAGVRKVIHFSAIGVEREQPSEFSATKLAGDGALMASSLDWVILRPSVVLGRPVFGASALFRGLAALPWLPVMPDTGRLQVVALDDIVTTVMFFLQAGSPARLTLDIAGPEALTMSEIVAHFRRWLGWKRAREIRLPHWAAALFYRLGDAAGSLGWRPPMRTNAAKEIKRGAVGDPEPWTSLTGIRPVALAAALTAQPPTVQDKWFARLYFVKPAVFVILPFFWIMTGIISLTTGWRSGVQLLLDSAVAALAEPAVVAGALADIALGVMIAWRPTSRWGLWGAIGLCLFYVVAGTVLRPDLWNEPLGPLMKILPILLLHVAALAILEER